MYELLFDKCKKFIQHETKMATIGKRAGLKNLYFISCHIEVFTIKKYCFNCKKQPFTFI